MKAVCELKAIGIVLSRVLFVVAMYLCCKLLATFIGII